MLNILARLRSRVQILFGQSIPVTLPMGGTGHFFPNTCQVLPTMAGASDGTEEGEGADDGDADKEKESEDAEDKGADDGAEGGSDKADEDNEADDGEDAGGDKGASEPDWKSESRKHERRAKKTKRELDELRGQLKKQEDERKSEHEKALEKAREEGRGEATTKAEKERQADRLEVAVTRVAAKPIKVGTGDDAKTVKFADSEDAHVYLQRAIQNGDLDPEDIFGEDGKVDSAVIAEALQEVLEAKPHLAEDHKPHKPKGDADAGKGAGAGKAQDDMSPEELFELKKKG